MADTVQYAQANRGGSGNQKRTVRLRVRPATCRSRSSWSTASFLRGYLGTVGDAPLLPHDQSDLRPLLDVYILDKALYEVGYELRYRPDWVKIPLSGIMKLLR